MTDPHGTGQDAWAGRQQPAQPGYQPPAGYQPPPGYPPPGYPPAPAYPPSGYPQPTYSQPDFSQPSYPQQPYGRYPQGGPQPPSGRRHTALLWVAVGVVVALAIGIGAFWATRDKHPDEANTAGRSLHLPSSFSGYIQVTSAMTETARSQINSRLSALGPNAARHAQIGVYRKGATSTAGVVIIALHVDDVPSFKRQIDNGGINAGLDSFIAGVGHSVTGAGATTTQQPRAVDPGRLRGAMRCSQVQIPQQAVGLCGWGDRSWFALTLLFESPSLTTSADLTRTLRTAAEH